MTKIDILAFSPHPDDAEIGCGALLLKAQLNGLKTAIIDMSLGERATRGNQETRLKERTQASQMLGLQYRESLEMPDTEIGQHREHEGLVIQSLRQFRPRIVLAPYFHDRHPDHDAAALLIKRAVFLANIGKLGEYKAHRVEALYHYAVHQLFTPSFVLDASSIWGQYRELITCYKSQFNIMTQQDTDNFTALNDGSFIDLIECRARQYGAMISTQFGEAYYSEQPIAFINPQQLLDGGIKTQNYNIFR